MSYRMERQIKIIACGLSSNVGPFKLDWFTFKDDPNWQPRLANSNDVASWNQALFTIAAGDFDYIAPHPYIEVKGVPDSRAVYLQTVAQVWEQAGLKGQYEILRSYHSAAKVAASPGVFGCCSGGSSSSCFARRKPLMRQALNTHQ